MKRMRDDDFANTQLKRQFGSSRAESGNGEGGGPVAGDNMQKLTTNDALVYLREVKDMFHQDQIETYNMFLDVMKDFKAQRIDTSEVIRRVKELFKGYPKLILGFNTFLPKGYEITLTDEEAVLPRKTVEFEEAISFVNKIKTRFRNDDHVYKTFLDILNMYRKEHKGISEVYHEVAELFVDEPDLLEGFTKFLPDTSAAASAPPVSFVHHSFHREERGSAIPSFRHSLLDKQHLRKDRITSPRADRDRSVECPGLDDDKSMMKFQKEQKKHAEKESRDKRYRDQEYKELENENKGVLSMDRLGGKRKSERKANEFGGHVTLASSDDRDIYKNMYGEEFNFCQKVKEKLRNPDDFQAFLKCLHIYSKEIISRKDLLGLVADLLRKYPDLMEGFHVFLTRCEQDDGILTGLMSKKSLWTDGHASKLIRTEEADRPHRRETDGEKEKDRSKEKYWGKSIQELDLSNCRSCTPSYRLLPDDYPISTASQRSELGAQVLNDCWVSVTSGSEDYSFKHMRRNQYEESLFRCEDDRFELDMLLESVSSAARRAEELLNSINDNTLDSDISLCIEDHFTVLNLRCIERLYGDHGLDVMDIFRKSPSVALPVILTRLKQKEEEWTKCRSDFNKVWAEIYAKNHYKSLDHRSFYFKQQDSKNLSSKYLVAEIKEIKEEQQKDDDVLLTLAAGYTHPLRPNLEFEYTDLEIHEDLYKLIKYSCKEVCSGKDLLDKVMSLWTTFVEPMLGVSSERHDQATEDDALSKSHAVESTPLNFHESDRSPSADATAINKQSKYICNEDAKNSPKRLNSCRSSFTSTDAAKEDKNGKMASGRVANSLQAGNVTTVGDRGAKSNMHDSLPSKGGFAEDSRRRGQNDDSVDPSKNEKEEGELSNGDFEEDNFAYQDGSLLSISSAGLVDGRQHRTEVGREICGQVASTEINGEAVGDGSENLLEGAQDVSGNESAPDEFSHDQGNEEYGGHDDLDVKAESEGEVECASHFAGGDGVSLHHSERLNLTSMPLAKHVTAPVLDNENKSRQVFYGNDTFYVLFRLHQILYQRLLSAKLSLGSPDHPKLGVGKDIDSNPYAKFMNVLYSLLDGSADNVKFEDECRSIFGNQSYVLFTLDKLIYKLVKQLQTVSSDELDKKLLQLYEYEKSRKLENYVDSIYYENAHIFLHDENIYRFESKFCPTRLSIQLMDDVSEKSELLAAPMDPTFTTYIYNSYLSASHGKNTPSDLMLKRNKSKYGNLDDSSAFCMAMEDVTVINGLEHKISSTSSKMMYVLDTEDFFVRRRARRRNKLVRRSSSNEQARIQKFHQFQSASLEKILQ